MEEAEHFLASYRAAGAEGIETLRAMVSSRGGSALDFTTDSVRSAFEILAREVTTVPMPVDRTLPDWITNSETYIAGLYGFSDEARVLVVRLSYFMAETVRLASQDALQWGVGKADTAVQKQPVLTGFRHDLQMSPLLVTENLVRRLIEDPGAIGEVDRAIANWLGFGFASR